MRYDPRVYLTAAFSGLLLLASLATACGRQPAASTAAPALAEEITLYDWAEDMPQRVLDMFEDEFGVRVDYIAYETQEEAMANMRAGKTYDVVVLDNDFLPQLVAEKLLAELDFHYIPNFQNISANFRNLLYDPNNKHSVPFNWGTTALVVREELVDEPITRWADVWLNDSVQVAMRNEPREPFGMALKSLGYSANTEDPQEVQAAFEQLMRIHDRVVFVEGYAESALSVLASGEAAFLIGWANDVTYARDRGLELSYIYPAEGAMLWGDSFIIPANSSNQYTSHLFLNFLLRPEIAAQIVNENYYATPNEAAYNLIDPELRNDPVIFPTSEKLGNAEVLLPLSPEATLLYETMWESYVAAVMAVNEAGDMRE